MQVYPDKLAAQLATLAPVYLVAGDEPLLVNESRDQVRDAAIAQGYEERELIVVDGGFNWGQLLESSNTMSLFTQRRMIELRLQSSKIGTEGSAAICQYLDAPPEDLHGRQPAGRGAIQLLEAAADGSTESGWLRRAALAREQRRGRCAAFPLHLRARSDRQVELWTSLEGQARRSEPPWQVAKNLPRNQIHNEKFQASGNCAPELPHCVPS